MKKILSAVAVATVATAAPAFAVVATSVSTGIRGADFAIAPSTHGMAMTELEVRAATDALYELPGAVGLSATVAFAYQSMRGSLGAGLDSFSGVNFGPELKAEMKLTPRVRPFATLGYRLGRYTGHGTENWSDDRVPALFLFQGQVNEAREKRFASAGVHTSLGCAATIWQTVSGVAALDLGFERMSTDTRIIDGSAERNDRTDGDFSSRALLVGARVDL